MSSDEEAETEEVQFFELIEKYCNENVRTGLLGAEIDTMDKLMAQYGMGEEHPKDPSIAAVLQKIKAVSPATDLGITGNEASQLRLLHRKGLRSENNTPPGKKAKVHATSAMIGEDAEDTRAATKAYDRLRATQNVNIPVESQLQHNLIHTMVRNLDATGMVYMKWELKALRKEGEKRCGFRKLKGQELYSKDDGFLEESEAERTTHGAVTEAILLLVDGLAAVLSKEVKGGSRGSALLVYKSGTTEYARAHATYHEVLLLGKMIISACSEYPLRYAEGILRQALNKHQGLCKENGFAQATTILAQHWPGMLQPDPKERAAFEAEQKVSPGRPHKRHTHAHTHTHTHKRHTHTRGTLAGTHTHTCAGEERQGAEDESRGHGPEERGRGCRRRQPPGASRGIARGRRVPG